MTNAMQNSNRPTIGSLRRRVTLSAPHRTYDDAGSATITWHPYATCWAAITDLSGREGFTSDKAEASVTRAVTMRHRPDVKPTHRITIADRTYEITAIIEPDAKRRRITCLASEAEL